MKLVVCVVEARKLPAMDSNGFSDPYVKLQLGRTKFKTKVVKKSLNPFWGEQFFFRVEDLKEELNISVLDEDKYFNDDFVGQLKFSISTVFDALEKSLGTTWYPLQPKNKKSKNKDCGEILLTVYFSQNIPSVDLNSDGDYPPKQRKPVDSETESSSRATDSPLRVSSPTMEDRSSAQLTFAGLLAQIFTKNGDTAPPAGSSGGSSNLPDLLVEDNAEEQCISESFEDAMRRIESMDRGIDTPVNLPGGILLDQLYVIAPSDLNFFIFSPDSNFSKTLSDIQGTSDLQQGPWKFDNGGASLKRMISYVKAPTKLIKSVKGFEEQTYLKGDGKVYAVLSTVSTPEVVYGNTFRVELLFCITPGPEFPSGEQSSRLVISWRMNFLQNTLMKGMIESGARQGLKDSFEQYASLLAENVKPLDKKDSIGSNKEQVLASLEVDTMSDWKLAFRFFANFTVVSTLFIGLYVFVHVWIAAPSANQGLEFSGLDLPDSIGEVIVCAIMILQGKRVLEMIRRFINARVKRGSDHGVKAQGDGWLLTVALIEGSNLAAVDSSGFSDPYVVFTCNGKTKTSSIKFQQSDPQWNEIYEFDAMDEPPSVLAVEVYDFDGPFDEATSLGQVEVNFVKMNILDLEDLWVLLEGKLAKACQSKLHLRIFLNNTRSDAVKDYLTKMEKEVGKKINVRSPQTNSAFQKLFGLPSEEFLINDFTCHLKRKMPLQGRLFLSPRIVGFHANLFGQKAKFFFLWEDIEDIQVVSPTLSSMGSPSIIMTLRQGKGMDARHGAKTQDKDGRLKFHFQSFVSFNVAHRTLMALWKARSLSPEQKVQIVEEDSEAKTLLTEESGSFGGQEDLTMSEVYATFLPLTINLIMELFGGCELERKVMTKIGCDGYSSSRWEAEKADVYQRQVCYKFSERVSHYKGEVTSTQQKSPLVDKNGWLVEEVMALHGVPLGDYFNLHLRYQVEDNYSKSKGCDVQVHIGIAWLKSTKHQKRIAKNIVSNLQQRLKMMFDAVDMFSSR